MERGTRLWDGTTGSNVEKNPDQSDVRAQNCNQERFRTNEDTHLSCIMQIVTEFLHSPVMLIA